MQAAASDLSNGLYLTVAGPMFLSFHPAEAGALPPRRFASNRAGASRTTACRALQEAAIDKSQVNR